jgi:hypothetical protein
MICDRCYQQDAVGEHGLGLCPLLPRRLGITVRQDSIPGGLLIAHGLCHDDGTPRRYDSHTEIREAARIKGLTAWTDIYTEDRTKDARVRDDWQRSGEAQRAKRDRDEARREKRR